LYTSVTFNWGYATLLFIIAIMKMGLFNLLYISLNVCLGKGGEKGVCQWASLHLYILTNIPHKWGQLHESKANGGVGNEMEMCLIVSILHVQVTFTLDTKLGAPPVSALGIVPVLRVSIAVRVNEM
jgi:hypothetical protein